MSKSVIVIAVAIVLLVGGWWIVSSGNKLAQGTGPIKIGVSAPLSGDSASYGESARAGALLAQKEINDAGGVNGRQIELVFEDDTCGSIGGVNAMQKLVNVDHVDAVIGPVCSAVAGGAIPIAREAGTPTIMIGASAPGLAGGSDSIFRNYPSDSFQGRFVAEYVYNKLGLRKAAILYTNSDWGIGIRGVFLDRFTELGGEVVFDESVSPTATDVRTQVAKIRSSVPDLVFMPLHPTTSIIAVKQFKEAGITATLFGGDGLAGEEFLNSGVSEGVMFAVGAVGNGEDFKEKIKAQTGTENPNFVTPLAYDAVKIFAKVIAERGSDPKNIIEGLSALSYNDGVSFPTISFDENGDLEGAAYDVQVAQNGKAVTVK